MPEPSEPSRKEPSATLEPEEAVNLRNLNRSPHPYYLRQIPDRLGVHNGESSGTGTPANGQLSPIRLSAFSKESTPISDSGTEADDEHFLKGLPAPKAKLHKGLRGRNEVVSGSPSPMLAPTVVEDEHEHESHESLLGKTIQTKRKQKRRLVLDPLRRNKNLVRRIAEFGLVGLLGYMVVTNRHVSPIFKTWHTDFEYLAVLATTLATAYPLRLLLWTYRNRTTSRWLPARIPSSFDPAPLLYPPAITLLASLLISVDSLQVLLPNIILSISALPQQLIPKLQHDAPFDTLHWAISCLPLVWKSGSAVFLHDDPANLPVAAEAALLLYPLHRCLCLVLHSLTTTSLLTAELQLLSIALVDILLLAKSPQVQILKALLWGGGLGILVACGGVIKWGIALARVPKWRFRRATNPSKGALWKSFVRFLSLRRLHSELQASQFEDTSYTTPYTSEDEDEATLLKPVARVQTLGPNTNPDPVRQTNAYGDEDLAGIARRHTMPTPDKPNRNSSNMTPSGRRKRGTSISVRPFLKLTYEQALIKKWAYAVYVYACILVIILVGIRYYVQHYALDGQEPVGWALGYLFGNIPWFRFQVVNANLERWVALPINRSNEPCENCQFGWVEHLRQDDFGAATTRLFLSGYWICVLLFGLLVVFQLKETYEVDTRRKVFHFMMVGMLLPATFVDPTYPAMALGLILAIFLILDLLRASQLPPLSRPIASFLAPYVDGRDFRGPVVISHIFLLIGCAIPLWLSLASISRTGDDALKGWEVPTRDVSMIAGVVCVGLGDAAASLIGRRYGHRKWLWGGGKSLEGSVAFAIAVFFGLAFAGIWLRVGRWPVADEPLGLVRASAHAGLCASIASVTEAVLTGGNDNVIVPVVLWTCVKSLGV